MTVSAETQRKLRIAMADVVAADELTSAINVGANPTADNVAALGATSNLTALVPTAATLSTPVVVATNVAASNFTAADPAHPTKAEIDTGIDTVILAVETALDLKTDNADLVTFRTEALAALLLKADNADVETLRTEVEARLDAAEAKIDAVIAALIAAGLMDA